MKPNLSTLVISVILLVMVFLPWRSLSGIDLNGFRDWGLLAFVMSILGIGVSFITAPKIRSFTTIFIGVLAIVGVSVFWSRLEGLSPGYGLIIALIASLGLITAGYLEYRKLEQPGKTNQPPQAGPPPPPKQ